MKSAAELLLEQVNVDANFRRILDLDKPIRWSSWEEFTQSDSDAMTAEKRDDQAESELGAFK